MTQELSTNKFNFEITSMQQAMDYAKMISESELAPKDYRGKPGNVIIAMQFGAEIGLKPMQAIQNIAVINGRPSIWGDAMIALVMNSPLCEYIHEKIENDTAYCSVKRKGDDREYTYEFSKADAKQAGLLGKSGPWGQYPDRMMQMRARGFALRDKFSDVLKGLAMAEEVSDYQVIQAEKSKPLDKIRALLADKSRPNPQIVMDEFKARFESATDLDELDNIADHARDLPDQYKEQAREFYKSRRAELKLALSKFDESTGELKEHEQTNAT